MVYLHKFIHHKKMIRTMMNSKVNLKNGIYNVIILLYFSICGFVFVASTRPMYESTIQQHIARIYLVKLDLNKDERDTREASCYL